MTPWKRKVAASFGAAAQTYESCSDLQDRVATILARRIETLSIPRALSLELGCGTGLLSKRLAGDGWIVTDLSPAMVAQCRKNLGEPDGVTFLPMDGEHPSVTGPFGLICANLAVQWFEDLAGSLKRLTGLLAPGGHLVVSTFGAGTFAEWADAHARRGLPSSTPRFPTYEALAMMFPQGGELDLREEYVSLTFQNASEFIKTLKGLGAQTPPPDSQPLSPGEMRKVLTALDRDGPLSMSHTIFHAIWTRD